MMTLPDFRLPVTPEQYEKAVLDEKVALFLVRAANVLDLEALSRRLRGAT